MIEANNNCSGLERDDLGDDADNRYSCYYGINSVDKLIFYVGEGSLPI